MKRHSVRSLARLWVLAALGVSCSAPPVDWEAETTNAGPAGDVAIDAYGTLSRDSSAQLAERVHVPVRMCPGSLRVTSAGSTLFGTWWSVRPDSSAALVAARSTDNGGTWSPAVAVDSSDRSTVGCRRSPPAIAADMASGYVHVSYGLTGVEGPGVFFAHSMDQGATFHSPVAIVYGEHPGRTSVASSGDNLVVAFEDPNGSAQRVGLALSRTMGHIFETRILPVSEGNGSATQPAVALRGRTLVVAWRERGTTNTGALYRIRSGLLP